MMGFDWEENGEVLHEPYKGIEDRVSELLESELKAARIKAKVAFNKEAEHITRYTIQNAGLDFAEHDGELAITLSDEFEETPKRVIPLFSLFEHVLEDEDCREDRIWLRDHFRALANRLDTDVPV